MNTSVANSSLTAVLALKNVKLFVNERDTVEVKLGKDSAVKAAYSYFNKDQGFDLRVSPEVTAATGRKYIKSTLSITEDGQRKYFNGILNPVKKDGSEFLFTGHVDIGEGERVKMFIKKATDKGFYPVSFSKDAPRRTEGAPASAAAPASADASAEQDSADYSDVPF